MKPLIKSILKYPSIKSEFEVHSDLFQYLKSRGLDVRGEVKLKNPDGRGARFDIVVYDNKEAVCVIEVKNGIRRRRHHGKIDHYNNLTKLPQMTFYENDDHVKVYAEVYKIIHGEATNKNIVYNKF